MTTPQKPEGSAVPNPTPASDAGAASTAASPPPEAEMRPLSPAARRALAEAEARRKAQNAEELTVERELGGRGGADPARYGDWEINGRAIDF